MGPQTVLIRGGKVIDGTGAPAFEADLLLEQGLIKSIGGELNLEAEKTLHVEGLVVAPGFVDIHSHSDYYLLIDPFGKSKIHQGVTTEVGGNCGYAAAPISGPPLEDRKKGYKEQFGIDHDWDELVRFFGKMEGQGISLNYGQLIGSNTVRASVMGFDDRAPTAGEMKAMEGMVTRAMDQGALGLSLGMVYVPTCYAEKEELVALAKVVRQNGGILTSHIRSESRALVEAITEVIAIARESGAPLQISHLKTMGEENWHKIDEVFALIEDARQEGIDVTCDRYPYLAANTGLQAILPESALAGGREEALKRLVDQRERETITREILRLHPRKSYWDQVIISQVVSEKNKDLEGKSVREGAILRKKELFAFYFDLLIEERMDVDAIFFAMTQPNLERILQKSYVMVGSDAGAKAIDGPLGEGVPHPRTFGTFPKVLGEFVREKGLFDLETAIHKMTLAPCAKFGIKDRGVLKEGYRADITIFNPQKVADTTTYQSPKSYPVGIEYVLVNGELVLDRGVHRGIKPGQVIRKT